MAIKRGTVIRPVGLAGFSSTGGKQSVLQSGSRKPRLALPFSEGEARFPVHNGRNSPVRRRKSLSVRRHRTGCGRGPFYRVIRAAARGASTAAVAVPSIHPFISDASAASSVACPYGSQSVAVAAVLIDGSSGKAGGGGEVHSFRPAYLRQGILLAQKTDQSSGIAVIMDGFCRCWPNASPVGILRGR